MIFYLDCEDGGRVDVSASMIDQQVTNLLQRPIRKTYLLLLPPILACTRTMILAGEL